MRKLSLSTLKVRNVGRTTFSGPFFHIVRLLCWCLREDRHPAQLFRYRLFSLSERNGNKFTVMYMKESLRVVQHFVAGEIVDRSNDLPVSLVGGLPRIIPGVLRTRLRVGDPGAIRLVLAILSLNRVIKCPGVLKLNTITDPFKGLDDRIPSWALERSLLWLRQIGNDPKRALGEVKLHLSGSAGPNNPSSLLGIVDDLVAWSRQPDLIQHLKTLALYFKGGKELFLLLFPFSNGSFWSDGLRPYDEVISSYKWQKPGDIIRYREKTTYLGRLALKEEGAGKVRIFAMADVVTQSFLAPLHKWIFDLLRRLPMDGTFDQSGPIRRLQQKLLMGHITGQTIYSYDLSAATDRLPIQVQRDLLSCLFGREFSTSWYHIMVDRDWTLLHTQRSGRYIDQDVSVRYAVGQPMGALSSWGMLALTHHVLVQLAASRVGITHFTDYALLGDDIVIANTAVAKAYHALMTQELGVDINLSKSLVSLDTFEFAKMLVKGQVNLSPIGPKNLVLASKTPVGILSLIVDLLNKGQVLEEEGVRKLFSSIPGVSIRKTRALTNAILGPFGLVPSEEGLSSKIRLDSTLSSAKVVSLLRTIDIQHYYSDLEDYWRTVDKLSLALTRFYTWEPKVGFEPDSLWTHQVTLIKDYILKRYQDAIEEMVAKQPVLSFDLEEAGRAGLTGWQLMEEISKKFDKPRTAVPMLDPFADTALLSPRIMGVGEEFFKRVAEHEDREWSCEFPISQSLLKEILKDPTPFLNNPVGKTGRS